MSTTAPVSYGLSAARNSDLTCGYRASTVGLVEWLLPQRGWASPAKQRRLANFRSVDHLSAVPIARWRRA